jgi:hypothetical protein
MTSRSKNHTMNKILRKKKAPSYMRTWKAKTKTHSSKLTALSPLDPAKLSFAASDLIVPEIKNKLRRET